MEQFFLFKMWIGMLRIQLLGRFEAWTASLDGKLKIMNCKPEALVLGTVSAKVDGGQVELIEATELTNP